MTYCIAWKSTEAIFMTSDSVITKTGDPNPLNKETSSLGELSNTSMEMDPAQTMIKRVNSM